MRATVATLEAYDGCQRKLVWFSRQPKGLYFEAGRLFVGTHTSYHKDGNIFRTSPATLGGPRKQGWHLPIDQFKGWYQLGFTMVLKDQLLNNPCVRNRDRKPADILVEVSIRDLPSPTLNIVLELIEPEQFNLLGNPDVAPPHNAVVHVLKLNNPWVVVTILGHEENLLVRPQDNGFVVSHYNTRYSANLPGVEYNYEAYG